MNHALRSPGIALCLLLIATLPGCIEDKTDHYADLAAARADRLFERGWLPDILPPSTTDLKITTTPDNSTARGRFRLDWNEYAAFRQRLAPHHGQMPLSGRDARSLRKRVAEGAEATSFSDAHAQCVFACSAKQQLCWFFVAG